MNSQLLKGALKDMRKSMVKTMQALTNFEREAMADKEEAVWGVAAARERTEADDQNEDEEPLNDGDPDRLSDEGDEEEVYVEEDMFAEDSGGDGDQDTDDIGFGNATDDINSGAGSATKLRYGPDNTPCRGANRYIAKRAKGKGRGSKGGTASSHWRGKGNGGNVPYGGGTGQRGYARYH